MANNQWRSPNIIAFDHISKILPTLIAIANNLKNIQNKWSYCCEFNMIDSDFIITILIDRLFMYTLYV